MKREGWLLTGLLVLALAIRLPHLVGNTIPFSFDHGRDSLAALNIVKSHDLRFIGPWTSIPGLFFGPLWYWLLAGAFLFGGGHPLAGAGLMVALALVQVWLAQKFLGVYEAAIIAFAPLWLVVSTGAVNPFPMTLVGLVVVILVKNIVKAGHASLKQIFALTLTVGLGWHFSSALSLFYLVSLPAIFIFRKIKLSLKKVGWAFVGFLLPFVPQGLFELKHNFAEVRAVVDYFSRGESQKINLGKIKLVTASFLNELRLAVLPDQKFFYWLGLTVLIVGLVRAIKTSKGTRLWPEYLILTCLPLVGFWWLHYNPWYVYGLLPVAVAAAGDILRQLPRALAVGYLALLVASSGISLAGYLRAEKARLATNKAFLAAKMAAVDYVYQQAEGKPFSSYQYLPEIYDYAYQYLYIFNGFGGRSLPVEFSYQPGEITYVPEKPQLLSKLPETSGAAEKIFLIIEKPENIHHYPLSAWLERLPIGEVVSRQRLGPELEVWEATKQ
ncbi:MAG: hypothetical protein UX85_C0005G0022 [Candidatus Beckwithbacteria bacterium GW2011_GWB1_47_15]|uniref:Glycosyltransferase RgtA/B/C/D-like domain-containing protein n=1 Tax=Candidatus Beckwithbacteria bacterium GW2011_GWB1_47_15 TaxID=1618371 RepID=A0A0G1RUI4_9BACT|nr:MAG: hypothetical protein UY43_C0001G0752 [Candidatus Beckwithbacteria bacterium GW2011_GWC1_49_16]KKU35730.1 MAG: hypothetical protein UX50_C0002G0157 [Candidatus Beckwithbacteria bacterium GW2011_GWA1_46_30]KKU60984.1 MAG: hypothetical protein UX85_C0005G0022 [Candidatus Beckwithbacteria bacterium GW2011_GWB1_47_15]KKU72289.1 MAG: hypothetical protein UX97_C0001G0159 [Candidatus Beckwithbacteria bacterium GW2011_GWA2_47_25]KKW04951.1 MAG: hypothetical protein UY37_C0001G0055 [Candidatus Be